jgi:hypothetical protein
MPYRDEVSENRQRNRSDLARSVARLAGRLGNLGARLEPGRDREWALRLSNMLIDALRQADAEYPQM